MTSGIPSGAIGPFGSWHLSGLDEMRDRSGFYMGLGVALILLGIASILFVAVATLVSVTAIGILLLIGGILHAGHAFGTRHWGGFFMHLIAAIMYVIVGLLLITRPVLGAASLTLLLSALFLVDGLFRIFGSLLVRFPSWGWVLLNGVVSVALGIIIAAQWPYSTIWVLGTFVGVDMILAGWAFTSLAMAARRLAAAGNVNTQAA